jgi:uncharacterized protein YgiM (DUF1202 family)
MPTSGLSPDAWKWIRAAIAVALLLIVVIRVNSIYSGYREAAEERQQLESAETSPSVESTASGEATQTAADAQAEESAEESAEEESSGSSRVVIVVQNGLNFRSDAALTSTVLDTLARNTQLELIAEENGWYKVKAPDGTVGYVSASPQYVRVQEAP